MTYDDPDKVGALANAWCRQAFVRELPGARDPWMTQRHVCAAYWLCTVGRGRRQSLEQADMPLRHATPHALAETALINAELLELGLIDKNTGRARLNA